MVGKGWWGGGGGGAVERGGEGGAVGRMSNPWRICFTLMTYFASSVFGLMIFVHRATCGTANGVEVRGGLGAVLLVGRGR